MANISDPFAIDPTSPASNSNYAGANIAENCAPSGINNALRALGSMLAQGIAYKSASISASVSTNIAATGTGNYMTILGVGPINSFGLVAGQQPSAAAVRLLHFASSCSVSHGPSIILLGAASRRTQPGDMMAVIHDDASADVWREWAFSANDGRIPYTLTDLTVGSLSASMGRFSHLAAQSASVSVANMTSISASVGGFSILNFKGAAGISTIVQTAITALSTSASTASTIPFDSSAPQNNEGANLFSLTFTPKNSASIVRVEALVNLGHGTTATNLIVALFKDNAASAVTAVATGAIATNLQQVLLTYEETGSAAARDYAIRYGADSGATKINHASGGENLGGKVVSYLRVEERI
jgi:hypothetical protein